jgi:serine/threonine protein kinase
LAQHYRTAIASTPNWVTAAWAPSVVRPTHTGELVAVKVLESQVVARDPAMLERFVREGRALWQLNHPNIVRMIAAVQEQGQHCLIVEYVSGGSLAIELAAARVKVLRVEQIAARLDDHFQLLSTAGAAL